MNALGAVLFSSGLEDDISGWVPVRLLAALVLVLAGWVLKGALKIVMDRNKNIDEDKKNLEKKIDGLAVQLSDMDKKLSSFATLAQLGSMGDRLDGRITNNAQEIAVLRTIVAERTKERPKR